MITSSRCYFHEMTNVVVSWKRDCSWLLQNLNCFWKFYSNLQFIIFLITLTGSWLDACRRVKPRHYCQLFFFILIYLWDFFQVVVSTWDSFCVWVSKSAFITEVFSSFSCFFPLKQGHVHFSALWKLFWDQGRWIGASVLVLMMDDHRLKLQSRTPNCDKTDS